MIYIFWFSIIFVFYAYFGYPLVLLLFSIFNNKKKYPEHEVRVDNYYPKVMLLISAYNEEDVIEAKILNSLELDYPKELLEIVVVSDGSSDRTNEIAAQYADKGIVLRYFEGRIGKTACLNEAVSLAKGEVIVFSDANSKYNKDAIRKLADHFSDETIGFVTGGTKYITEAGNGIANSIGLYSKIEQLTKVLESKISSPVGADGAIFAIRKGLYQPLKGYDINDLVIPLNIIKQGFRGIYEPEAFCIEKTSKGAKGEFNRQVRITNRTIRAIVNNRELLNPFNHGSFSFQLISHKVCKLLVPYFLILLFFTNILLIRGEFLYTAALSGQIVIYLLSWLGYRGYGLNGLSKLINMSHTFINVNYAILWGWIKYIKGETYTTWNTSR